MMALLQILVLATISMNNVGALLTKGKSSKEQCITVPKEMKFNGGRRVCCPDDKPSVNVKNDPDGLQAQGWCSNPDNEQDTCQLWNALDDNPNGFYQCEISATEDHHMSNMLGTSFNVHRPGAYTLVEIPRNAQRGDHTLFIAARINNVLGKCEDQGFYIKSLYVSGNLFRNITEEGMVFDVEPKKADSTDVLRVRTAHKGAMNAQWFANNNTEGMIEFAQLDPEMQNLKLKLGPIALNIAGRRRDIEGRNVHVDFMNVKISGLNGYTDVGGIMGGAEDYSLAATVPTECQKAGGTYDSSTARPLDHASWYSANTPVHDKVRKRQM